MREEGWYTDPYGLHERRWFSDGSPTKLVSDDGTTSNDPPPNTPFVRPPEPVPESEGPTVDDSHEEGHEDPGVKKAWEAFVETGGD
jgi:hypothetical protein